jgi:MoaA/NifB/PqqE/SkfB family radical SAM enzyme
MSNFCPAPWTDRFVRADGTLSCCCFAKVDSESEIENLKDSFIKDIKDDRCQQCWEFENNNLKSLRQTKIELTGLMSPPKNETNTKEAVNTIMCNVGSLCNAECIVCNGGTSSARNEWAKIYDKKSYVSLEVKNSKDIRFDEYPNLEMVTLLGGEPSIHPWVRTILSDLIASGRAKSIDINLTTNSSSLDDRLISQLSEFRDIFVTLSLDGVDDIFEYQRRPLKWDQIKQVADKWMEISFKVTIGYVVTAITAWALNDFIAWYSILPRKDIEVRFDPVSGDWPNELSVAVLTKEQRDQWIASTVDHPLKTEMLNIINNIPYNASLVPAFKNKIQIEDQTAKKKFAEIFPNWQLDDKA